jgi:hypothetical protein
MTPWLYAPSAIVYQDPNVTVTGLRFPYATASANCAGQNERAKARVRRLRHSLAQKHAL